jgi:putative protease
VTVHEASAHEPEILAPAGDAEALGAAIAAGADAVYFGLTRYSARARATNFDLATLPETLALLHKHGVRGYVAFNTLLMDRELGEAADTIRAIRDAGADALIVQDLGVLALAREVAPDLPLHASTQATCTDAGSCEFVRELGASRVILARELSLDDIRKIRRQTSVELEVFVHGALCIAYSGQCLTSEAIGGRSANRGACAQACRLPYDLIVDGQTRDLGDKAYLLSPEDLEASAHIPALRELGIRSLKIEGRLKGSHYVAATVALYRRALGRPSVDARSFEALRQEALATFTRGSGSGFFAGTNHQRLVDGETCDHRGVLLGSVARVVPGERKTFLEVSLAEGVDDITPGDGILVQGGRAGEGEVGGRVWSVAHAQGNVSVWLGPDAEDAMTKLARTLATRTTPRRVFRTHDPKAQATIERATQEHPHRVGLTLDVTGVAGSKLRVHARSARGHEAEVFSSTTLEPARGSALDAATLHEKLGALGTSGFVLERLHLDIGENLFVSPKTLKELRRALVDALERSFRPERRPVEGSGQAATTPPTQLAPPAPDGLYVLCRNLRQARGAIAGGAQGIVLDFLELTGTGEALRTLRAEHPSVNITLTPPRIRKPDEEKIDQYLRALTPDAYLVRGLGALREVATLAQAPSSLMKPWPHIGDFSLNVANQRAARVVLAAGLAAFTPSFDLNESELFELLSAPDLAARAEVVLHHPMPLFHMEHCVFAALLSSGKDHRDCGRPCERHELSLRDRAGLVHPVFADVGCRNTVFHGKAQSAATLVPRLRDLGVRRFRIEMVRETEGEVAALTATYGALVRGALSTSEARDRVHAESGYGVVRGSLRVLNG